MSENETEKHAKGKVVYTADTPSGHVIGVQGEDGLIRFSIHDKWNMEALIKKK